ncbi:hypothetical protein HDU76_004031 [Blyttiomyces sp. JEL0837]|nr:hypothetical protein HDU76_004031 [Blyttiomyces sp. JEL0837]
MARTNLGQRHRLPRPSPPARHPASTKHLRRCITNYELSSLVSPAETVQNEMEPRGPPPTFFPNFKVVEEDILIDNPLPSDGKNRDDTLTIWLKQNQSILGASTVSVGQVFTARKTVSADGNITFENHNSGTYFWLQGNPENVIVCISRNPVREHLFNLWEQMTALKENHGLFVQELYDNVPGLELSFESCYDNETVAFCGYSCIEKETTNTQLEQLYGETVSLDVLPNADVLLYEGKSLSLCKVVKAGHITTVLCTLEVKASGGPYLDANGRVKGMAIASYYDHPRSEDPPTVSIDDLFDKTLPVKLKESNDVHKPISRNRNLILAFSNPSAQNLLARAGVV